MFTPFGREASVREPDQSRNYWRAAIDICDGTEKPEKVNISIDKSKGTITASGVLPVSGSSFKKVVSFPNNVRSETIQSTLQGKTLTLSGETDPAKIDGLFSGGFGRAGFGDSFDSNASRSFNDMAKNFFGNSWNEFDTPFNNSGPLTDRPSSRSRIRSEMPVLTDRLSSVESPSLLRERTRSPYSMSPSSEAISIPLLVQTEPILVKNCNDAVRWEVQLKTEEKILSQQIKISVIGNTIKITGEFEKTIEIPSDVEISKIRTWIKDKSLFIAGAKKQNKPELGSEAMSAPINRLVTNSADKWEVHVDLGANCPDPSDLSIVVKQNFLCIYIGQSDADKKLHDRVSIPVDVKPKTIQTAIKGKVLVVSAPKGLARPTMFNSTADIDLFPRGIESVQHNRPNDFSEMQSTRTPISSNFGLDSTFPEYNRFGSPSGSYEVIENSPIRYQVRVPVTSELLQSSANILVKVNGHKITIEAKIEATDAYGNLKISKICKDVTLPSDCDMKTLKTKEESCALIISAEKNPIPPSNFVPIKERQAYEGRGVNSPWTLAGSSPRPSSQADTFSGRQSREEILPEARTSETRARKHSKNVRFSEDPPKVTQVDTDEPPSPQIAQNSSNKAPPRKKGIGRMDSNDFIMAEEEDVSASLRSLTLPILEERPASIPPGEPIEDLGVFGAATPQVEKADPFIQPILQKPQDFVTKENEPSIVPLKVVTDNPPVRQMATRFPNYNTDPITRPAEPSSSFCSFSTDGAGFPPPPPCVTGASSATTFGKPLMPPPAYYDSTSARRDSVDIPVEHESDT